MQSINLNQRTMDFRFYWRQVRKRPWLILTLVVICLLVGGLWVAKTPPLYRATAQILIDQERPKVSLPIEELVQAGPTAAHYQTQYQLLQSRVLARRVIDALGLRRHPEFAPTPSAPRVAKQGIQSWIGSLQQTFAKLIVSTPADDHAEKSSGVVSDPDTALINRLLSHLEVESKRNMLLVDVSFTSRDPGLAAKVVNTLTRLYIEFNMETRFAALQDALDWLEKQVGGMRHQVESSEHALHAYKDEHNIHLIDDRLPGLVQEITALSTSLTQAKTQRIELETLYDEIQRAVKAGQSLEWLPDVVQNQLIQTLKGQDVQLQRDFVQLNQKYGDDHPQVMQLKEQSRAIKIKIQDEVNQIARAFSTQYQMARAREKALSEHVMFLQHEVQALNGKAVQYGVLKREAESNQRLADLLLNRLKEASVSTDLTSGNNIRVIDPAEVPTRPINIHTTLTLGIAAFFGLFAGVGLVTFIGYIDNTLKTPEEAEEFLGIAVTGAIERYGSKRGSPTEYQGGVIVLATPHSKTTEAFKMLRANLLCSYTDPPRKVFLVTSPHPHDGKSTVAANLAIVMAQTERRVLLVDADLRNPSLHRIFEVEGGIGLSDMLLTETYTNTTAVGDDLNKVSMIPAGGPVPNPSELLESQRMKRFITFARDTYDIVIIDTPPVLAVSDAVVLSPLVDGILVVIKAGATPYDHARSATNPFLLLQAEQSEQADTQTDNRSDTMTLGLVMNFLDPREGTSYGYYGYHNYYHGRSS